jgi:dipeptidase D
LKKKYYLWILKIKIMAKEIKTLEPLSIWGFFYELTQIPRPTGHMDAVTRHIIDFGRKLGLETSQDNAGNVIISKPASPGYEDRKKVVLQSHLDMVPQKNSSVAHDFHKDPIDAYIDGDWVKARGTTLGADNGIGVSMAMAVLADESLKHGPLEALFTVDEEVGMDGAFGLKHGFVEGRLLINCDSEEEGKLFVGCAGGADLNATFDYKKGAPLIDGDIAVRLFLTGLKGGHSGVDIHLGRANANKLMFRFLKEAVSEYGARLAFVEGGSLRNAIPREAEAVITVPKENVELLWEFVADHQDLYRAEYAGIEDKISFKAEITSAPAALIPEEIQDDLINSVEACQNGVVTMLNDFPGTVESSSNLAIVKSSEGTVEIKILARSSSESRKNALLSSLESAFSLAGAKVELGAAYNGWQPNAKSPLLKVMEDTFEELYGKKPEVTVMHAGLECGIIQGLFPEMDMISLGPDLKHPHSPDEAISISSVQRVWEYLKTALGNIPAT